jgi:hypothetical protein
MKYGQIAKRQSINAKIYKCFEHLCEKDVLKFVKKFREQPHDQEQVMHTFRELILGAFLASNGFNVRYDHRVDGKTPDWCLLDNTSSLLGIIELINFHIDRVTETAQKRKLEAGRIWVGWMQPNNARLYQRIREKADIYDGLVKKHKAAYVVSVFGEFTACVEIEELHQCLFEDHGGIFKLCPILSGVLFFEESDGQYSFKYIRSPKPAIEIDLPSGNF